MTEELAHQIWSRVKHSYNKGRKLDSYNGVTFSASEQTAYGIDEANKIALTLKIEALEKFMDKNKIDKDLQFYQVLQLIMKKYEKTYVDTAKTKQKYDITFIKAY